jgi:hypothetical protein
MRLPPLATLSLTSAWLLTVATCLAEDWPGWRGPRGDGTSTEKQVPVKWDGANQNGITMAPISTKFMARSSQPGMGTGSISALSLSVLLTDATDTPLYRSRGGIQLLQRIKPVVTNYQSDGVVLVDLAPAELFQDSAGQRSAVHFALRDLVLPAEQLDLELGPSKGTSKEKKKK